MGRSGWSERFERTWRVAERKNPFIGFVAVREAGG